MLSTILGASMAAISIAVVRIVGADWLLALTAAFALWCWQIQLATRHAFISKSHYKGALKGDVISWIGQATIVGSVFAVASPSIAIILLIAGSTSLLGAAVQIGQRRLLSRVASPLKGTLIQFWNTGKWVLAGAVVTAILSQALLVSLALSRGSAAAAEYQAVANLLGVTHPVMLSVGNLIIPSIAVHGGTLSVVTARRIAISRSTPYGAILLPFFLILFVMPSGVLQLVYGSGSTYLDLEAPLRWFVFAYMLFFVANVIGGLLYGVQRTRHNLFAQAIGTTTAIIIGAPLAYTIGVKGAAMGLAFSIMAWVLIGIALVHNSVAVQPLSTTKTLEQGLCE
jgi:O-antigen/teichoic acid export membrane protein